MSLLRSNTAPWNKKTVLFVHGIGKQPAGYSEPLYKILHAADPDTAESARWHEIRYDDVNDTMLAKLKMVDEKVPAAPSPAAAMDLAGNFFLDLVNYLFSVDIYHWINNVYRKELAEIAQFGLAQSVTPKKQDLFIISHSLGTVVTYETLHSIITDPQIPGLTSGVHVKTLFTLGSPLAFIKARQAQIPSFNKTAFLRSGPLRRPERPNPLTEVMETNVAAWFNMRQKYDPVASLTPVDRSSGLSADTLVFEKFHSGVNAHDFGNYLTEYAPFIMEKIRA